MSPECHDKLLLFEMLGIRSGLELGIKVINTLHTWKDE